MLERIREIADGIAVVKKIGCTLRDLADNQGGYEGRHVQKCHQGAGNQAQQYAHNQGCQDCNGNRDPVHEQEADDHAAEGDVAADGEVNALDHNDLRHADRRNGDNRALADNIEQVAGLQKVRHQRAAEQEQRDAHDRYDQRLLILLKKLHLGLPLFRE